MQSRPKIGIVSHSYPCFDGDFRANFIESLAVAYSEFADVVVFTPYVKTWRRSDTDAKSPVQIVCYRYFPFASWHTLGAEAIMKGDLSLNWLKVLAVPFMILAGIWTIAKELRTHKYDMIQAHWAIPNTIVALLARLLAGRSGRQTKVFTSFPGSDVTVLKGLGPFTRPVAKLIAQSDFLSCNSTDLREDLVACGFKEEDISLVIYGVDDRILKFSLELRKRLRALYGVCDDQVVLLLVGRFVPKKGFSMAFKALPGIHQGAPNAVVWVIGDGDEKAVYEDILQKNGCSHLVHFLGKLPVQELYGIYSAADILLMPSQRLPSDGLNVVVPEAMACARPIVASNVGGNDIVVFDGLNGFLHDHDDLETMIQRTIELCRDKSLRDKQGAASLSLVQTQFNWRQVALTNLREIDK